MNTNDDARIAPIIQQIEKWVENIPGWTPIDQLYTLFVLAQLTAALEGDVLEIGSWCGRSAVVLGYAARLAGNTSVTCIDLFPDKEDWSQNPDGSYSFKVELGGFSTAGYQEQTVWQEPFEADIAPIYEKHDSVFDAFQQNISAHRLGDIVTSIRGDSRQLRDLPEFKCRLAFLDGDHGYDAVCQDIEQVESVLVPGGWIAFDDAFSSYSGVNRAIEERIIGSGKFDLCQQMTRKMFIARRG